MLERQKEESMGLEPIWRGDGRSSCPTSLLLVATGCRIDRLEENEGRFAEAWIKSLSVTSLRDQSKG